MPSRYKARFELVKLTGRQILVFEKRGRSDNLPHLLGGEVLDVHFLPATFVVELKNFLSERFDRCVRKLLQRLTLGDV